MENLFDYRKEYAAGAGSLFLSFLFYAMIAFLIFIFYCPNVNDVLAKVAETAVSHSEHFKPEPVERALFFLSLISLPISLCFFYAPCYNYFSGRNKQGQALLWCALFGLLLLMYLSMISQDPYGPTTNFQFYFSQSFLSKHFYVYSFLVYPFLVISLLYKRGVRSNFFETKIFSTIVSILSILILLLIFFLNIFSAQVVDDSGIYTFHFNAVFYSVSQVFAGSGLLCHDFTNTYGLYPYFLLPLLKFIGLDVFKFTFVMSLLTTCSFLLIFFTLRKIVRNKAILFLGFTSLVFMAYLLGKIVTLDYYYQYHPLRYFFPFLIAFLAVLYVEEQKPFLYYCVGLLAPLAVLWNFDSGMIVYFSWIALLIYREVLLSRSALKGAGCVGSRIAKHILAIATIAIVVTTLLIISIKMNYGNFPALHQFFGSTVLFSSLGYFMLPMPLLHPWNIVLLTYFAGIAISIRFLIARIYRKKAVIIFFFSVLGLGSFSYYQGRSHNWNLLTSSTPFFILITIFTDSLFETIREHKLGKTFAVGIFSVFIYILSVSFIDIGANYSRLINVIVSRYNLCSSSQQESSVMHNIEFIKKYTTAGEMILIFSGHQGVYFAETAAASSFQPGLADLFFRKDYERLIGIISAGTTKKIFIDPTIYRYTGLNITADIFPLLKQYYKVIDSNGSMALLVRREKE